MPVKIVSPDDVPVQSLEGRTLQWLVTTETVGANNLSMCIMECPAGSVVRPLHGHHGIEEMALILQGQGEAWVDGEVALFKKGDVLFLPADSKHMVRNTGSEALIAACITAPLTTPESYVLYEGEGW